VRDAIAALVERAHSLDGDSSEWLDEIVRAASSALGRGVVGNLVERRADGALASAHVALHGVCDEWCVTLERTATRMGSEELERRFTTAVTNERGVLAVSARGGDRLAILLDAPLDGDRPREGDERELLTTWRNVAEHLAAGLRLRSRLAPANDAAAARSLPDDAEGVWHALLDGRVALVDRFDRDGRRFVVLRPCAPHERAALTIRERQVLASVALGHANKRIAMDLGVSESTISAALRGAARKLGVRSRVELARILGPARNRDRESP
jgi:DNA-binding CsgD family transcriptional regulator